MRTVSLSQLCDTAFSFSDLEIFPESWTKRHAFSQYADFPRPSSALFFICTNITVTFHLHDGDVVCAKKGDVVFIPSGIKYSVTVSGGSENRIDTYTLNFRLMGVEELHLSDTVAVVSAGDVGRFEVLIERLNVTLHPASGMRNNLRAGADFYSLLDTLAEKREESFAMYYPIRAGVEALKNEWNENKDVPYYASLCGVSESYFYRCFHVFSGKSPVEYRNELRLSNAEAMLRNTDMKIGEIAETVGFDDPFYFCRIFSKAFGISPREYRKRFL